MCDKITPLTNCHEIALFLKLECLLILSNQMIINP